MDRIGSYVSILRRLDLARRSAEADVVALLEEAEEIKQALPPEVEAVIFPAAITGKACPHGHDVRELRVHRRSPKDVPGRRSRTRLDCLACRREHWNRQQRRRRGPPMTRHEVALRANAVRWARARAG